MIMENLELLVNHLRKYENEKSSASISRLIKEACEKGLIKKLEETAPRHTKYIPIWA